MTGSKGKTYRKYDQADTRSEKKRKKRSKASGNRPRTGTQNTNVKDGTKRNEGANRDKDGANRNQDSANRNKDGANRNHKNADSQRSNQKRSSTASAARPSNQKDVYQKEPYQKDVSRQKPGQKEKSFRKHSASTTRSKDRPASKDRSTLKARSASTARTASRTRSTSKSRTASANRTASGTSLVKRRLPKRKEKSPAQIMRKERRKKRRMAERYVHFIAVFSVAFLVAIAVLSIYLFGYLKAMLEYKELNKQYVTLKGSNIQAAPDQEVKGVPDLKVNFKGLSSINADVASWIYMPGVDISYPVVRGKDNDYYLQHTFEKNVSLSGAIFMDYQDSPDLVGFNTFIYGHNMRNGTMFGSLKKYLQDETLIQSAPYFYLYLKDGSVKKYRIFAYYQDDGNSDTYSRPSKEGEEAYLAMIRKKSFVRVTLTPEEEKQAALFHEYVTLSTCTGFTGSGRRFLVHGVCVDTE